LKNSYEVFYWFYETSVLSNRFNMFASFLNRYGINVDMENLADLGFHERNQLFNETCAHLVATIQTKMVILLDDIQNVRHVLPLKDSIRK